MNLFVRVDDRLLHGQVLCAWVPYNKIDTLLVASDKVSADIFQRAVMNSCGGEDLNVVVDNVDDAVKDLKSDRFLENNVMVVVTNINDAKRLFDGGVDFKELNIGNLCNVGSDGYDSDEEAAAAVRMVTKSVILNTLDDDILHGLRAKGVAIDIRTLPDSEAVEYS